MPSAPDPETIPDEDSSKGSRRGDDSLGWRRTQSIVTSRAYELLVAAVEHHALPRLLAAHGGGSRPRTEGAAQGAAARPVIGESDVGALLACVATPDFHLAEAALTAVAKRGFTRAEILVHLLTPAARRLHARWLEDQETFAAVALATGRLQRLIRSDAMPPPEILPELAGGIVLVSGRATDPRPFEVAVVADFFRGAQWDTECLSPRTESDLANRLEEHSFDCLVLVCDPDADPSGENGLIDRLRRISVNRRLHVLVSGPAADAAARPRATADAVVGNAADVVPAARNLMLSRVA